jgi:urease accessory protein
MSAATYLSDPTPIPRICLDSVRVCGGVSIRASERLGESRIIDIRERDGYKVRSPRRSRPPEAVIINTGGGIAGGDDIMQDITVDAHAALTVTTQASERIYRSLERSVTKVDVCLSLGEEAALNWLPQDTILFEGSRLERSITAEIAPSAQLLLAETVVFGRAAMGEQLTTGLFRDSWRIRRGGKLVFAENILLRDEMFRMMSAPALAGDAHAALTLVYVAPNAEDRLAGVRNVLNEARFSCAASAWNGLLVVRGLAPGVEPVRHAVQGIVGALDRGPLPRVWWT